ncbi:hypothetical protein L6452_23061 [Arctium lappa]|uniref:Uncharacterized protein n=1 Tax=Arctium lappa TaxID=4217 RepID=A0ACB9B5Q7_ARCLA|nr:hypothetical protein L6452_23061 [Arctium lappa]
MNPESVLRGEIALPRETNVYSFTRITMNHELTKQVYTKTRKLDIDHDEEVKLYTSKPRAMHLILAINGASKIEETKEKS